MLYLISMRSLLVFFLFLSIYTPKIYAAETHPLRPFPGNPVETTDTSFLTPYCASRPTAVQPNTFDKRNDYITLTVNGELTSDFSEFITPLLSITNPEKPDYDLNYEQKAKRYLADYLEGRAYYEPEAEIQNPSFDQQREIFSRIGVIRKLTPQTYQDKLKRILIKRGRGDYQSFDELKELYGFKPSSLKVNPKTPIQWLTLNDFYDHWAPLPEEFTTWEEYQRAYDNWANCNQDRTNCSLWYTLWPYVPLFTREDSVGQITPFDEPGQTSNPQTVTNVYHPHLARTYEAVSALSNMLSPWEESPIIKDPELSSQWITPAPWNQDPYWIDSGQNLPPDSGTVCDPQNTLVLSSGDLALDSSINTTVAKELTIKNPRYDPNCAVWVDIPYLPEHGGGYWDDSNCYFTIDVRFSPTSLKTRTPFLAEITDRLTTGKYALFNIFRSSEEVINQPPENLPGVGLEEEQSPNYSFSNGSAEAGNKNPGTLAKYYYKYLGYVHCQKEKLLARLSPADTYIPFATECEVKPETEMNNKNLSTNMNCRQNLEVDIPPGTLNKEALSMLAENWRPGGNPHVEECYNEVVSRAIEAGVNPTFALLIWLNESGGSNYDGFDYDLEDFGIHKTNNDPNIPEANDFSGQLDFFLNLPSAYSSICGKSDMETFTARFKSGSCTPTQDSLNYLNDLKTRWDWIAPGIPFPTYP